MSALPDTGKRCVIWFGKPEPQERFTLAAGGWQMRESSAQQSLNIGMRDDDLIVGVIDLRACTPEDLHHIEKLATEHRHLPLFAITPSQPATLPVQAQRILDACLQHFPAPVDPEQLLLQLETLHGPPATGNATSPLGSLLGRSPAMLRMLTMLRKFAVVDLPVLITGETGTGKEAAAQALHQLSSRCNDGFHAINCGAIPPTLVQSELFGHERGAFTGANTRRQGLFETANGGIVFLDEIGDLPLDVQTSLLRVLQEGCIERVGSNASLQVDVRILAATHVDLEKAVAAGRFRSDLYYRLNVLRLPMPALRDREGDIILLAQQFLREFRLQHSVRARDYSSAALQTMARFDWPGNVRELLNRVHRAAVTAETELISCKDLDLGDATHNGHAPSPAAAAAAPSSRREALLAHLAHSRYNVSACAQRMQVSRVTIYRLCRKYKLDLETLRNLQHERQ